MLKTHLNSVPYPKLILIEDSVTSKGGEILNHLAATHQKRSDYKTYFFIFHNNFKKIKDVFSSCICYDFVSDSENWFGKGGLDVKKTLSELNENCVVVVDSLVHVLYRYGLSETYKMFAELKDKKNIQQIITLLHTDLLESKDIVVINYFHHLSSLYIELEGKRLSYCYKKSQRKIIKQIEEYRFENNTLITETIKKPDKELINDALNRLPENLSTFKIGLTEKDKESRENLVLPYLPKEDDNEGGKIHYSFDDTDDWDEEDPDDDLDI